MTECKYFYQTIYCCYYQSHKGNSTSMCEVIQADMNLKMLSLMLYSACIHTLLYNPHERKSSQATITITIHN